MTYQIESFDVLELDRLLRNIHARITRHAESLLQQSGICLSLMDIRLLLTVEQSPPLSITLIADKLGVSHPAVIKASKKLIEKGLLYRDHDSRDNRRINLLLTARGKALSPGLRELTSEFYAPFSAELVCLGKLISGIQHEDQ